MQSIQLADDIYDQAKRRADAAGFDSVDDYIAEMLSDDIHEDHIFTLEQLSMIDKSLAEVRAGAKINTPEEVEEMLAENRAEWMRKNGS